jgi:hypothetical protein
MKKLSPNTDALLKESDISDNLVLIRIAQTYCDDMSDFELYDATRGRWIIAQWRLERMQYPCKVYACAVYKGVIKEVYEVSIWLKAATMSLTRPGDATDPKLRDRYEFVGRIAPPKIRNKYISKDASALFSKGDQHSLKYFFVD